MNNDDLINHLLSERKGRREASNEIAFRCPFHDDDHPSAYYNTEKRTWNCKAAHCMASGGENKLREALGLPRGVFDHVDDGWPAGIPRRMSGADVHPYTYTDMDGHVIGYVTRADPPWVDKEKRKPGKIIRQFFNRESGDDGATRWLKGADEKPRRLYGLHRLKKYPDVTVYVVEGEKCVDAMSAIRMLAVTSPGGAPGWSKADWTPLSGRRVVIWPDNDTTTGDGRVYSEGVAGILAGLGCDVSVVDVEPLGLPDKGDVFDWLAVGGRGAADIEALAVTPWAWKKTAPKKAAAPKKEQAGSKCSNDGEAAPGDATDGETTWMDRLLCTDKGVIKVAIGNMLLIFQNDEAWAGTLGFNERTQCVVFRRKPPADIRADVGDCLTDEHVTQTTIWLQEVYNYALRGTALVHLAMIAAARLCSFDPVKDWLETLKWDGTERLNLWLPHLVGCDATPYSKAVGAKVLISAVARVYEPGAKVDTVMVLTGPQGTLKSTLLRELAVRPEWFTDHLSDVGGKDAALQLCGPWIMEFAELDGITGRREAERVKSWLTQTKDRFRPPYGRSVIDIPRRVVFTGTSNLHQFLRDETGGRRFLPIEIREIDIDGIRSVREQLWAEARHRYLSGENWWLEGDVLDEARCQQEERRIADPWEDEITKWIVDQVNPTFVTSRDILTNAVKVEVGRQTKADLDRVGRVLGHSLGWTRSKRRDGKIVLSVWYPPKKDGQGTVVPLRAEPQGDDDDVDEKGHWR